MSDIDEKPATRGWWTRIGWLGWFLLIYVGLIIGGNVLALVAKVYLAVSQAGQSDTMVE